MFNAHSCSPLKPSIPHLAPATRQPNLIASPILDPDINLCITAALNVSPAPNVSTRPPGGGKEEEVNNYKIIINFDLIK